ncbi:Nif11-like leader peptide family natural product precursor [Nostoc sp. 'Peltigera membranacea cyanobiont' 210A]|uniref:Nif11 family protein n=1 Tax=Nostoc sp. 'Peltigera membranacea cyanobiont' 210A TaxID=2014529 RepID=UPI000B958F04|nr:Nif11 family protein [Nostoc sp. 'Peltigera membranacea cyanobiont' 210A]OYD95242.1 Nif11-like leader peptide family natural product precursor [Nostoc sp. 'Peltigera membranacea cyanobiont' 210A]
MSLTIFEKVKEFLIRIVKDETFYSRLMSEKIEEVRKVMEEGGYNFSQEEFETASIKILELKELGQFDDLSEEELVGAFGGLTNTVAQPLYGAIVLPPEEGGKPSSKCKWIPKPHPKPWPLPCQAIDPPVQALYGAVVSSTKVQ